jgi:uncharacterized protein DUF1905/bacteriocin resistance YdeI/OmpD-like protein
MPAKKKLPSSFSARLDKFDGNLWYFHIMVPGEIAQQFVKGTDRRVLCMLNGSETFQAGLMPNGGGGYFININKKIREKLDLKLGSEVHAALEKDTSDYGLPMPEELAELLKLDDEGNTLFHSLTPGKQRTLLYIIATPKNVDIRIRRAICVVDHLKENNGKIDYKLLNVSLKNSK